MPLSTRNLFSLLLLIAVVVTWYLIPGPSTTHQQPARQTDYFITGLDRKEMGQDGELASHFRAERVDHYPDEMRAELVQPRATTYNPTQPPWHLRADHGTEWEESDLITLRGGVVADQHYPDSPRFSKMETNEARLQLDNQYMETEYPITFTTERTATRSVGAKLWLDTGEIQLLKNSSGRYN